MARNYYGNGFATVGTDKTALELVTTAAIRAKIYKIIVGSAASPASQAALWQVKRHTATGTGTALTAVKVDPADPVALVTCKTNNSAEPTYTAADIPWELPLNQQASWEENLSPGKEIVLAASATAGAGLKSSTATGTAVHQGSMYWEE